MKKTVLISEIEYRLQSAKNKELNNIMNPMSEASIEARVAIQCFEEVLNLLKCKPSIPTDDEIEEKAKQYALSRHLIPVDMLNSIDQYDREHVIMIEQAVDDSKNDYIFGYKQALKDLGLCK